MARKRVVQDNGRTAEQVEKERAIRATFQQSRPSLASLVGSGEFCAAIKHGEYLRGR
jgi:hypothetical protein